MARVVKREVSVISKVTMVHVRAKYIRRSGYQPPFSSNSITGLSAMGIGTTSFAAAARADELVDTSGATVAAAAGGKYLYSPSVKRPSGGINDRTLSRSHFWRLCVYRIEFNTVPSILDTDRTQGWNAQSVITRGFEKFIMQSGTPGHVQPLNAVKEERTAPESFALVSSLPQAVLDKGVPCLWQSLSEARHHAVSITYLLTTALRCSTTST